MRQSLGACSVMRRIQIFCRHTGGRVGADLSTSESVPVFALNSTTTCLRWTTFSFAGSRRCFCWFSSPVCANNPVAAVSRQPKRTWDNWRQRCGQHFVPKFAILSAWRKNTPFENFLFAFLALRCLDPSAQGVWSWRLQRNNAQTGSSHGKKSTQALTSHSCPAYEQCFYASLTVSHGTARTVHRSFHEKTDLNILN